MNIKQTIINQIWQVVVIAALFTVVTSCAVKSTKPADGTNKSSVMKTSSVEKSVANNASRSSKASEVTSASSGANDKESTGSVQKRSLFHWLFGAPASTQSKTATSKTATSNTATSKTATSKTATSKTAANTNSPKNTISANEIKIKEAPVASNKNNLDKSEKLKDSNSKASLPAASPTIYETTKTIETTESFKAKIAED